AWVNTSETAGEIESRIPGLEATPKSARVSVLVEAGVWLLVILTPVALGSVAERDTALMEGGAITLLTFAWCAGLRRPHFQLPRWLAWTFLLFSGWSLLQIVPLPPQVLKILSPGTQSTYSQVPPGYAEQKASTDAQSWLLARRATSSHSLQPRSQETTGLE